MAIIKRHKRPDGTYLVYKDGDNMHKNHYHIAPDGTILSIKENGEYFYNRGRIRQQIAKVLPEFFESGDWTIGWTPE